MSEEILVRQGAPTLAGNQDGKLVPLPLRRSRGTDDGYPTAEPAAVAQGAVPAAAPLSAGAGTPLPLSPRRTAAGSAGRAGIQAAAAGGLWR